MSAGLRPDADVSKLLSDLREDLLAAGYTYGIVEQLIPADEHAALRHGFSLPAQNSLQQAAIREQTRTLVGLFIVGSSATREQVDQALPKLGLAGASSLGLIEECEGEYWAAKSLTLYEPTLGDEQPETWWILSDLDDHLRRGPIRSDHVMGIGQATRSLVAALPANTFGRALDLGTGCGIVSMELSRTSEAVIATDLSIRALEFARMNLILNQIDSVELRAGDLFDPVSNETFDLVATNPPFVITPVQTPQPHPTYRATQREGDSLLTEILTNAPQILRPGGTLVSLANWEIQGKNGTKESDPVPRLRDMTASLSTSHWFMERSRQTPLEYAHHWARDGGLRRETREYEEFVAASLTDFQERAVEAICLGYVQAIRVDESLPAVFRYETHAGMLGGESSFGEEWNRVFRRALEVAHMSDDDILSTPFIRAPRLQESRVVTPGTGEIRDITFQLSTGIERLVSADTYLAALIGACDGELTIQQVMMALAELLELDLNGLTDVTVAATRELSWLGVLSPSVGR